MEITISDLCVKNDKQFEINNLNLTISDNSITGIYGNYYLIKKIFKDKDYTGEVLLDSNTVISYIDNRNFLTKTVSDEFYLVKKNLRDSKDFLEKVLKSLEMVGLTQDYLNMDINTLSNTEKKLISIALALIIEPDLLIFDNIFSNFDDKNMQTIKKLIIDLKKKYHKTIIIVDYNINFLYELATNLIIFNDNILVINDSKNKVFEDINLLQDNNITIPFEIQFNYVAKNHGIEINKLDDLAKLKKEVNSNVNQN